MIAVAALARRQVSVALSGDGGDEMLGGYDRYRLNSVLAGVLDGGWSSVAAGCGSALMRLWPEHMRGRGIVRLLAPGSRTRYQRLLADPWLAKHSIVGESDLTAFSAAWDDATPGLLNRMCKTDLRLYLPEDLMTKVDRACMAVGLEARAPFLDRPLFEFLARTPPELKSRRGESKRPLRRLVARAVGPRFVRRRKQGFAVPLGRWFRHELHDIVDSLAASSSFVGALFPRHFLRHLVAAHATGSRDLSNRIWMLLVLEGWHARFGGTVTARADA